MKNIFYTLMVVFALMAMDVEAQRMRHGSGGGNRGGGGSRSINGGANRSTTRPQTQQRTKPSTTHKKPEYNANKGTIDRQKPSNVDRSNSNKGSNKVSNNKGGDKKASNRTGDRNSNNNRVNIDNSRNTNVNVRVNHNHNNRYYNGRRGYHPYYYHPYHPYYYGPMWHPFGFFVATVAVTAVIVSVNSQPYYYDNGVYYMQSSGGYTVVNPPTNIVVNTLPEGVETIQLNEVTYYYFGGAFYAKTKDSYKVIPAPDGAVVTNIPEGGEEVEIEGNKYVFYNNTYFQPLSQNGKDMYQVVSMEEAPAELVQELPKDAQTITVGSADYYYSTGVFYSKSDEGYQVVAAPNGAVVKSLPEGAKTEKVDGVTYKVFNNTYFQPLTNVGDNVYQVVVL